MLGLGVVGDDAPAVWRDEARRLLFVGERPYIERALPDAPDLDAVLEESG